LTGKNGVKIISDLEYAPGSVGDLFLPEEQIPEAFPTVFLNVTAFGSPVLRPIVCLPSWET
jgi:hypothetical protein